MPIVVVQEFVQHSVLKNWKFLQERLESFFSESHTHELRVRLINEEGSLIEAKIETPDDGPLSKLEPEHLKFVYFVSDGVPAILHEEYLVALLQLIQDDSLCFKLPYLQGPQQLYHKVLIAQVVPIVEWKFEGVLAHGKPDW
jgi:hypothetical protein